MLNQIGSLLPVSTCCPFSNTSHTSLGPPLEQGYPDGIARHHHRAMPRRYRTLQDPYERRVARHWRKYATADKPLSCRTGTGAGGCASRQVDTTVTRPLHIRPYATATPPSAWCRHELQLHYMCRVWTDERGRRGVVLLLLLRDEERQGMCREPSLHPRRIEREHAIDDGVRCHAKLWTRGQGGPKSS